jgi:trehalose/maltose hydrolase-like predicted phosphorylase
MSGPLEHHISGCVAFAAWNYFSVTQDLEWLREKGYPMISSIA